MKKYGFALIFVLSSFTPTCVIAQQKDDEIANAVFADVVPADKADKPTRAVGFAYQDGPGVGLVYSKKIDSKRTGWIRGAYFGNSYLFMQEYGATAQVANVEINKTREVQLAFGVDQDFALPTSRYWKFVLGVAMGADQSEYESKYYRQLCNVFCGYDRRSPKIENQVDTYAFVSGTIGFRVIETKAWGLEGSWKVAINPILARTGSIAFKGPDGREFEPLDTVPFTLEALVVF